MLEGRTNSLKPELQTKTDVGESGQQKALLAGAAD